MVVVFSLHVLLDIVAAADPFALLHFPVPSSQLLSLSTYPLPCCLFIVNALIGTLAIFDGRARGRTHGYRPYNASAVQRLQAWATPKR